jgi:hypothetical protein
MRAGTVCDEEVAEFTLVTDKICVGVQDARKSKGLTCHMR